MIKLNDLDFEVVRAFAENDMNVSRAASNLNYHPNTVRYHLDRVDTVTGLNPRHFHDLVELLEKYPKEEGR